MTYSVLSLLVLEQQDYTGTLFVIDEGAAMIELAFDIAPAATYKFHTALNGQEVRRCSASQFKSDQICCTVTFPCVVW